MTRTRGKGPVKAAATIDEPMIERAMPTERRMKLSEMLEGDEYQPIREAILKHGKYTPTGSSKTVHIKTRPIEGTDDHEVLAIGAISRDPGKTQDVIDTIQDFLEKSGSGSNRGKQIKQYWEIYKTEGLVNNAINKYASLLSGGGRAKVRKAKKGKLQKALEVAQQVLDHWITNVNGPSETSVASGARGLKAITEQGIRVALVEGNFMGRQVWTKHNIEGLGQFSMPMTIQTISMEYMEPVDGLASLGDFWFWKPEDKLAKLIKGEGEQTKEVKAVVKQLFGKSGLKEDSNIVSEIKKNGKVLLHPALLCHVKHRGSDRESFGESFIEPAKLGIRYSRAVTAADMVSMENVINQILVVMVGSSDPNSPYSKADVAQARTNLMQSLFEEPSPNMTIVWQGDDVKVEVVGSKQTLPDFGARHTTGEQKIIAALGIPTALLSGTTSEGKAAGWAAMISASGQAEHLGSSFANVWTTICKRILLENGFTDIDVVFEFDKSLLADKNEERLQNRADYLAGVMSIKAYIASTGRDPDAEFIQKCLEKGLEPSDEATTWELVFTPPQGLQGQGDAEGDGGPAAPPGQGPGKDPAGGEPATDAPPKKVKTTVTKEKKVVEQK